MLSNASLITALDVVYYIIDTQVKKPSARLSM